MFEIYAYGNVDTLTGVFNAIAAIMGGADYFGLIKTIAVTGVLVAAFAGLFTPGKFHGWGWLMGFLLVYYALFLPKSTVVIVDKLGSQPPVAVGNVPIGVAFFGHATSRVGDVMTRFFETAFQVIPATNAQLPGELAYQKNGVMFGNRLIQASRAANVADPQLRTDLIAFVHNCTVYDLQDGTIDPAAFARSTDIWSLMGAPNPARFTTYGNPVQVDTCPNAYTYLAARLPAEVAHARSILAFQMNPTLDPAAALTAIDAQIEQAYYKTKIATAAQGAADLLRQNIMINLVQDARSLAGQKLNDPAALMIATARANATASVNSAFLTMGKIAEQALPLVRNVIEAVVYAVFPFVFLLFLLAQGRGLAMAIKSFAMSLVWIQLWPPLYAILNYVATLASARNLEAAAKMGTVAQGLALETAASIYSGAVSDQAIAGYMVISIPIIATAIIKGGEVAFQAVTGVAAVQSAASSEAAAASKGTLLDALTASLGAAIRSPEGVADPVALLWTDADGQWRPLLPALQKACAHLYVLGGYAPAQRTGPAIWLKCVVDRTLPDLAPPPGTVPILYLPGVSRQELRAGGDCPDLLHPLIELQYRGAVWHQKNGRDWTVEAFMTSEAALGLDLSLDMRTREALMRALPVLATEAIAPLRGRRLDADDFDRLSVGDPVRDLLGWMSDPEAFQARCDAPRWEAFRNICAREFGFDPDKDGPARAGDLMLNGNGKWEDVWRRFRDAPRGYPGVTELLRHATPRDLLVDRARQPQVNDEQETQLDAKNDCYLAELPSLALRDVRIEDQTVRDNERMLTDGFYAEVTLSYDGVIAQQTGGRPFKVDALRPIQMSKSDVLDVLMKARQTFSVAEWIDFLLRSIGLEASALSDRAKKVVLLRMVPFVERNYNMVELGPRGTGKSHLFQQISPYSHLISGGKATVAKMFVNNSTGQRGLVCQYDVVCFDEVSGISFDQKDGVNIMKGYMASGQFSRGKENIRADGSLVMVGNLDVDVEQQQRVGHLLSPLPPEMRNDTAFMDRLHAYVPGWDFPKLNPTEHVTDHFGLVSDFLSECWDRLRAGNRVSVMQSRVHLGGALSGRDIEAVNKTVSGLAKLLFPDPQMPVSDEDLEWMVRLALESRRRVKEQQRRVFKSEFRNTHFSYILGPEGVEQFVSTPELHSDEAIETDPLPPGQVWGANPGSGETGAGLYRIEVTCGRGSGVKILNQPTPPAFRESVKVGEQNLYTRSKELVGDRNPREEEFSVQMRAMDSDKAGAGLGLPVLVALCGSLLNKNTRGGTVVVGALNLGGSVELIPNAARIVELAIDKQAQTILMPVAARRQLNDLPDDLWTKISIEFYKDSADAVFKALVE